MSTNSTNDGLTLTLTDCEKVVGCYSYSPSSDITSTPDFGTRHFFKKNMSDERAGKILRWVDLFLNPLGVVVESYEVFLPLANFQLNTFSFRLRPSSFFSEEIIWVVTLFFSGMKLFWPIFSPFF